MRIFITNKIKNIFAGMAGFLIAVPLLIAGGVYAATVYPAGSLLQPSDVTSSHIRNNTIVNVDVNSAASILLSKLHGGGTAGLIPFSNGSTLATSTALSFATTTNTLTVTGGLSVSATTTLNGVAYQWPSADGSSNQAITTDGAGTLGWTTLSQPYISTNFTAGETIGMGNYVAIGDGSVATTSNGTILSQNPYTLSATNKMALSVAVPASGMTTLVRVKTTLYNSAAGTSTPTIKASLRVESAGNPGATEVASTTATLAVAAAGQGVFNLIFATPVDLTPSTTYWVVLSDTANLNVMKMSVTNGGGFPSKTTSDEATWTPNSNDSDFHWVYTESTPGRAYKANATINNYLFKTAVGFATATTTIGNAITVANFGYISGLLSGLTIGSTYYLSTTSGLISTATTTNSLKVGRAVASTILVTTNP